jgi:ribosomal protein S18 acetylase RimI-like enzyme
MMMLVYDLSNFTAEKPTADISMVTDYDVRYLRIISKLFKKNIPEIWKDKKPEDLLAHLDAGGKITVYWHGGVIVGAVVWEWDVNKNEGRVLQICFIKRLRLMGYGSILMDFILHQIINLSKNEGLLYVDTEPENEAVGFFKSYGFTEVTEAAEVK